MFKTLTTLLACGMALTMASAQKKPAAPGIPTTQPYGKIDMADMELKACDFEKDANAMVLFDKGDIYYDDQFTIHMEAHKRIKIFNDNGKKSADIRIVYYGGGQYEFINGIEAETFNLVNGKIEVTKLDKKVLYSQVIDKSRSAYVFTFPNVKPGSVIEYRYKWTRNSYTNFPAWYFQSSIPVRYSELDTQIPDLLSFRELSRVQDAYVLNKSTADSKSVGSGADAVTYSLEGKQRALANIHSLPDEPYMTSDIDNLQSITYQLTSVRPIGDFVRNYSQSWQNVSTTLMDDEDFGAQFKRKLANEEALLTKAKALKSQTEKIAYIFKEVQTAMKWDGDDQWYTSDGTSKAWDKKSGNSSEINLILYHLLNKAGVTAYPMVVSTREHGRVNPYYYDLRQFNRAVVYIPVDSTRNYVLDATDKYNTYTDIPDELLNAVGLSVDKENKKYELVSLVKPTPAQQTILVNADIAADGKMAGSMQMTAYSYNRINNIRRFKKDGEEKYIDFLRHNDNSLKISDLKFDNMEVDTLPLFQKLSFKQDLTGSDGTYIYFVPAMFAPLRSNPFLSESRMSDIDFGYRDNFSMVGSYKIPAGYKTDALPKNITMQMPDQSITFRRIVGEQDGAIVVRFVVDYKKSIYARENYAELFDFYKKLHELINEQVVLKKS